jgi:hypothetical protein
MPRLDLHRLIAAGAALGLIATGAIASSGASAAGARRLTGTLVFSPGKATRHGRAKYTGTYFRMLLPGATDKFFPNADSRARDKSYTLLRPGTDGGLRLGSYQPPPHPAFGRHGSALAKRITRPETFEGVRFSISTAPNDAQSGAAVRPPSLTVHGRRITGDLRAWTAEWSRIYFNQGSPKPNGSFTGSTKPVTGTYNPRTHAFEITWYSLIVGGPFSGFTGYWHLQGHVRP